MIKSSHLSIDKFHMYSLEFLTLKNCKIKFNERSQNRKFRKYNIHINLNLISKKISDFNFESFSVLVNNLVKLLIYSLNPPSNFPFEIF